MRYSQLRMRRLKQGKGYRDEGAKGKRGSKATLVEQPRGKELETASSRSIKPVTANPVTQLWWCCNCTNAECAERVSLRLQHFFTVSAKNRVALLQTERGNLCSMTR